MADNEKKYPVYKWHLIEVTAVQKLAEELRDQMEAEGPKDMIYAFFRWFCCKLQSISDKLGTATGDIVMFDRKDRIFIEKISTWLKQNPEVLTA